jgi:hypothetical protein
MNKKIKRNQKNVVSSKANARTTAIVTAAILAMLL